MVPVPSLPTLTVGELVIGATVPVEVEDSPVVNVEVSLVPGAAAPGPDPLNPYVRVQVDPPPSETPVVVNVDALMLWPPPHPSKIKPGAVEVRLGGDQSTGIDSEIDPSASPPAGAVYVKVNAIPVEPRVTALGDTVMVPEPFAAVTDTEGEVTRFMRLPVLLVACCCVVNVYGIGPPDAGTVRPGPWPVSP